MMKRLLPGDVTPVTEADLEWWLAFAPTLEWIWAKTYADSAPHWYVTSINGRTKGLTMGDCIRAARVIHTFGEPGKFYDYLNIYLTDPATGKKWWTMDDPLEMTDLVNMAEAENTYGVQNAPSTRAAKPSFYDTIAVQYDRMWKSASDLEEDAAVRRLITGHFGAYAPTTLDVGCGTGLLLDMGVTSPALYTGIDPSQGMLNELVKKHNKVATVIPATAEEVLLEGLGADDLLPTYDLVVSLFASASYTGPAVWEAMRARSNSLVMYMTYEEGYLPDYWTGFERTRMLAQIEKARLDMIEFAKKTNAVRFKIGRFDVTVIEK